MRMFLAILLCLGVFSVVAGENENASMKTQTENNAEKSDKSVVWHDDFAKAQSEAKEKNLPIFALFTGSDWCPWCVRLHDEVLATEEFTKYAANNLVLFIADFPRNKSIPATKSKQYRKLANEYGVRGFPTVILLNSDGKSLGETGYQRGGGKPYVEMLKEMLKK